MCLVELEHLVAEVDVGVHDIGIVVHGGNQGLDHRGGDVRLIELHVESARVAPGLGDPDVFLQEAAIGGAVGICILVVGSEDRQSGVFPILAILIRQIGVIEAFDNLFVLTVLAFDGGPLEVGIGEEIVGLVRGATE